MNTANTFYTNHFPYEFVYDTNIKRGAINFEKRTTELSIGVSLLSTEAWKTINDLQQGLKKARGNDNWNFSLSRIGPDQIVVAMRIINEDNIVIATGSHTFIIRDPSESNQRYSSQTPQPLSSLRLTPARNHGNNTLTFQNVKAESITDKLIVQVVSVNGISAQRVGETGLIQITTINDYNNRMAPIRAAAEVKRKQQEEAAVAAQIQRDAKRPLKQPYLNERFPFFGYVATSVGANSFFSENNPIQAYGNIDFGIYGLGFYYPLGFRLDFLSYSFTHGRRLKFNTSIGYLLLSDFRLGTVRLKSTYLFGTYITGDYIRQGGWGPYFEYIFGFGRQYGSTDGCVKNLISIGITYFHSWN